MGPLVLLCLGPLVLRFPLIGITVSPGGLRPPDPLLQNLQAQCPSPPRLHAILVALGRRFFCVMFLCALDDADDDHDDVDNDDDNGGADNGYG